MCNYWLPWQIPNEIENIWSCRKKGDLYPDRKGKWHDFERERRLSVNLNGRGDIIDDPLRHSKIYNQPCLVGLHIPLW